jgi:hypothetical protein
MTDEVPDYSAYSFLGQRIEDMTREDLLAALVIMLNRMKWDIEQRQKDYEGLVKGGL